MCAGEGVRGQRLPCGVAVSSLEEGMGRLVLATGCEGPEEPSCCRPPWPGLLRAGEGPGTWGHVWGLNQPEPDCSLVRFGCGAPKAPKGTVAKPHPWLSRVSPVSVGT